MPVMGTSIKHRDATVVRFSQALLSVQKKDRNGYLLD